MSNGGQVALIEGPEVHVAQKNGATTLNWQTSPIRRTVTLSSGLVVYILGKLSSIASQRRDTDSLQDRNSAYNYWVLKAPNKDGLFAPSIGAATVVLQAGYLMRNVTVSAGPTLNLVGDFNATTKIEVIGGAPRNLATLNINGKSTQFTQDQHGVVDATIEFNPPAINVQSLSSLDWKYIDSLPEIQPGYDDSLWPSADLKSTFNDKEPLRTPVSLFGSDYGFNTGVLLFRGHFTANGKESSLFLETQGGSAFGTSVWVNGSFAGSFDGYDAARSGNMTYAIPQLQSGKSYVITVVVDQMGMSENYVVGQNAMKSPRGILRYMLVGHAATDISWKLTGNLGGENYFDKVRGPLNEGGLWAERQGYHLPGAPIESWASSSGPTEGTLSAGVAFYGAQLDLDLPRGWDVPLSFTFTNGSDPNAPGNSAPAYRVQLYVNGYQFGKYVHNIGPQTSFPVPEGIW